MTPAETNSNEISQENEDLLRTLAKGLSHIEPLSDRALQAAYGAHLMSDIDAGLAELVYDSAVAEPVAIRRSDAHAPRFLSFTNEYLTLDLTLPADQESLIGEIDPPLAAELAVEGRDGEIVTTAIDQFGRFRATLPAPSFRLVIDGYLITQWITR